MDNDALHVDGLINWDASNEVVHRRSLSNWITLGETTINKVDHHYASYTFLDPIHMPQTKHVNDLLKSLITKAENHRLDQPLAKSNFPT